MTRILDDATHAKNVKLPDEDRRRIYVWLDGNAPFYGAYDKERRQGQLAGKAVSPPEIQ